MKIWDKVKTPYWFWIIEDIENNWKIEYTRYWVKLDNPTKWIPVSYFFKKQLWEQ
jgi:hypothetical protein